MTQLSLYSFDVIKNVEKQSCNELMSKKNDNDENAPVCEADKKRAEIEGIIQSKRSLKDVDEEAISTIVEFIEEKIYPFSFNNNGRQIVEKLYRNFDLVDIIEAIEISASKYLKYNSDDVLENESAEVFINKIGGILNLMNRPPIDKKIAYVKGICRNRFNYWNERNGTAILKDYIESLKCSGYSESAIIQDFDEDVIPRTKEARNWSEWKSLIVGWTSDLYSRSKEGQTSHQNIDDTASGEMHAEGNQYIEEKRRGGANSYQAYKPLREKVEELCKNELEETIYSSANQLCNRVASIIQEEYPELLRVFQPYQNHAREGTDWKKPTFYGWVNAHYKASKT